MANGRVITGFSMPWVALYAENAGTVSYSGGMPLARGVSVSLSVEGSSDNGFYADNVLAESDRQAFTSGTVTLTVDGLKATARKLITGTTSTTSVTIGSGTTTTVSGDVFDDLAVIPYVGIGYIVRYMEDGVTSYVPTVLYKCKFSDPPTDAETQGESIDFQTTALEATIMRDDSTNHRWKVEFAAQTTESAALDVIKAVLTPAA